MLVAALIVVWVVVGVFVATGQARGRLESRAEILDLIAGACRRGLPLPALLTAYASEITGKPRQAVTRLATRLDEGASLGAALGATGRRLVPAHVVAAVEAAEGTPRLPAVLEAVAADAGESLALRHRFVVAALYPLLLAFLAVGVHTGAIAMVAEDVGWYRSPDLSAVFATAGVGLLIAAVVLIFFQPLVQRLGWMPGSRRLGSARVLATSALLVEGGLPLDDALRRAAPAGGHGRLCRAVSRAADRLGEGEPVGLVWSTLGLPAVARLRLEAASASALGRVMGSVARQTFESWRRHSEQLLRWMTPVAVLIVGALVLVDFRLVIEVLEHSRDTARLW